MPAAETASATGQTTVLDLHRARDARTLRQVCRDAFRAVLGDLHYAVIARLPSSNERDVFVSTLPRFVEGTRAGPEAIAGEGVERFPLVYGNDEIGCVLVGGDPGDSRRSALDRLLPHVAVSLVNLELNAEALKSTDYYCQSLQALQEGVILFQEQDPEAVSARFLELCAAGLQAVAGAVYLHDEIGNAQSPLVLDHSWAMPEHMLADLELTDGTWWPGTIAGRTLEFIERSEASGEFEGLDNSRVPPPLENLIGAPLSYHGVDAGVVVLCNANASDPTFRTKLESSRRLCELGAALFHRRELEVQAMEHKAFETELQIASTLQKRLIPSAAPACDALEFAWNSTAARFVGGDYLDCLLADDGEIHAIIADISGHGINSAMLMTSFRATYRSECRWLEPDILMTQLNNTVVDEVGDTAMFLTGIALRFAAGGRGFRFSSAGHNPCYLYRASEDVFLELCASGPPLGFVPGAVYESQELDLEPGDLLVLYTDGVVEASAADSDEMFETVRLEACVRQHAHVAPDVLVRAILDELREFTGHSDQEDDISILVARAR